MKFTNTFLNGCIISCMDCQSFKSFLLIWPYQFIQQDIYWAMILLQVWGIQQGKKAKIPFTMNFHSKIDVRLLVISEVFFLVISQSSVGLEGEKCTCGRWRKVLKCNWVGLPSPHSSTLAWKILWMEEPGELQSMGSLRLGHDWATSLSLFTFMHWRRKWQPTPVFLPGESQERRSLVGCRLWSRTESDMTEAT